MLMFVSVAKHDLTVMNVTDLTLGSSVPTYKHVINEYVRGGSLDFIPSTDMDVWIP